MLCINKSWPSCTTGLNWPLFSSNTCSTSLPGYPPAWLFSLSLLTSQTKCGWNSRCDWFILRQTALQLWTCETMLHVYKIQWWERYRIDIPFPKGRNRTIERCGGSQASPKSNRVNPIRSQSLKIILLWLNVLASGPLRMGLATAPLLDKVFAPKAFNSLPCGPLVPRLCPYGSS